MTTALWLLGRGTGVATLLLLTAAVVLGVLTGGGYRSRELPRFASPRSTVAPRWRRACCW